MGNIAGELSIENIRKIIGEAQFMQDLHREEVFSFTKKMSESSRN